MSTARAMGYRSDLLHSSRLVGRWLLGRPSPGGNGVSGGDKVMMVIWRRRRELIGDWLGGGD